MDTMCEPTSRGRADRLFARRPADLHAVGDVAAWDTFSTLHMATLHDRATTPETRRLLWRVSVTGRAPIYGGAFG